LKNKFLEERVVMDDKLLYKSTLPLHFYPIRFLIILVIILSLFFEIHFAIIFIEIFFAIIFLSNDNSYVIELYQNYFKVILPSFYGNYLKTETKYYYRDVTNFIFTKSRFSVSEAIAGTIINIFIPFNLKGLVSANKKSRIQFNYYDGNNNEIDIVFSNEHPTIIYAIDLIQNKLNTKNKKRN